MSTLSPCIRAGGIVGPHLAMFIKTSPGSSMGESARTHYFYS